MDLLILNGTYPYNTNPHYRGTEWRPPAYHEELSEDHVVNRAWQWFVTEGGRHGEDVGMVHDLAKAQHMVDAYRSLLPPEDLEIVEVTTGDRLPTVGRDFLGYDLSSGFCLSLIASAPADTDVRDTDVGTDPLVRTLQPLFDLIGHYFSPHLNAQRLFATYEMASLCLRCLMAIQTIRPGFFEYGDFEAVGLWKVPTTHDGHDNQ